MKVRNMYSTEAVNALKDIVAAHEECKHSDGTIDRYGLGDKVDSILDEYGIEPNEEDLKNG